MANRFGEDQLRQWMFGILDYTTKHPIACSVTLIQLGYDPFPLSVGRNYWFFGQRLFLPNPLSYANQLRKAFGWQSLFIGIEAGILKNMVQVFATRSIRAFINTHWPELGGNAENEGVEEKDLTNQESFKRTLRNMIRGCFVRLSTTIISQPFNVIMIRQIAQLIGGEEKYTSFGQAFHRIVEEEGPAGLFSGIVPFLIFDVLYLTGIYWLDHFVERLAVYYKLHEKIDKEDYKKIRSISSNLNSLAVVSYLCPSYHVAGTMMAVGGTGLAASLLPFTPLPMTWQTAYDFVNSKETKRCGCMLRREYKGDVLRGTDNKLYAMY